MLIGSGVGRRFFHTCSSTVMNLHQLVYQSRALIFFEAADLADLLSKSRIYNRDHGITGLLLFTPDGRYLQLLEGDRAVVHELYHHIEADPRHADCRIISEAPSAARCFANWHMAYRPAQAVTLRTLLAPVIPPDSAALLLPRPRPHVEFVELLLDFVGGCAPMSELEAMVVAE